MYTPDKITELKAGEIFVFGSNLKGMHGGGAAAMARARFGAIDGVGVGLQGRSYAIPTMHGGPREIRPYVNQFIAFAASRPDLTFLVTRIGCGIAGFTDAQMAPLFEDALRLPNVALPKSFADIIVARHDEERSSAIGWDEMHYLNSRRSLTEMAGSARYFMATLRARVFRNTADIARQGFYFLKRGKVRLAAPPQATFYSAEFRVDDVPAMDGGRQTELMVENCDCLEAARREVAAGGRVAVLNMASAVMPGGGVRHGTTTQEDHIFRCSNIMLSLFPFSQAVAAEYGLERADAQYPLDRNFGGIYSPGITVFRENEEHGFALSDRPFKVDVISVAAIDRPRLTDAGTRIDDAMVDTAKNKIRTILRIGLANGNDTLILGAFGCGAFRNPPAHVAQLFREVFDENEFRNKFRRVCFAIIDGQNARGAGNYRPFRDVFS